MNPSIALDMVNTAHNVTTFKAAAQAVRDCVLVGSEPEEVHRLLLVLALRGHYLISTIKGRERKFVQQISTQVVITLRTDPLGVPSGS